MKQTEIPFADKYASGFCKARGKLIVEINPVRDKEGGFITPYVNTLEGDMVVISPTDRIVVRGKKVVRVITTENE